MRSAWPHQRENDPDRHCVATVLPHNAMFSLTFAGVASVDLSEPPFCNVLSFAVIRRYSAACHTTSYSGENGLVWYGPHDLIVGHAGRGMIFVRCSRLGSGENGEIFRLVACRVFRLTPRKDLPVGSVAAAERWARLDAEERSRLSRIRESRLRQSQDSMLADAEQWRRLFDTGVTSDSPEAQRLAAQIMDKNIKAKAAKAQVPQDAEGTGRHAVVRHVRRRPLRSVRRPALCRSVWSGAVRQQGVRRLRQRGHSHSRSASCAAA